MEKDFCKMFMNNIVRILIVIVVILLAYQNHLIKEAFFDHGGKGNKFFVDKDYYDKDKRYQSDRDGDYRDRGKGRYNEVGERRNIEEGIKPERPQRGNTQEPTRGLEARNSNY